MWENWIRCKVSGGCYWHRDVNFVASDGLYHYKVMSFEMKILQLLFRKLLILQNIYQGCYTWCR